MVGCLLLSPSAACGPCFLDLPSSPISEMVPLILAELTRSVTKGVFLSWF